MRTLSNFYQSKDWINLTHSLRLERLDSNGQLICQHCGQPITRAYDAVGHHVIHLTEENVNDVNIALNPDNVVFVHMRCHNRIHDRLGGRRREVCLVYGSPLAGKTTYVMDNLEPGDLVIDLSRIWACLSCCPDYVKPPRLNANVFAVRDALLDQVRTRLGKWERAWIVGGYPLISERERICRDYGAREIFIDTPREECLRRLHECNDGRDIRAWEGYINTWWERFSAGHTPPGSS